MKQLTSGEIRQVKGGKGPLNGLQPIRQTTRIKGAQELSFASKIPYQNVKVKYGLGQSFRLPQSDQPKPSTYPGVSVEALTPYKRDICHTRSLTTKVVSRVVKKFSYHTKHD
ncbi:MAG: hypothetical protein Ct9H300mP23_06120 [Nitrospinota bacterium]|nr:MAG: hypothetical protein Ct9H300mP23_06120 [Nitrospinota bacterium]